MGHDAIADLNFLVFAIEDVSIIVEQILIQERFSAFTVKSRREMVNIVTCMDAKTVALILRLKLYNKAQWEIGDIARQMRKLIVNISDIYPEILGPDCEIKGKCIEEKEFCGKIKILKK